MGTIFCLQLSMNTNQKCCHIILTSFKQVYEHVQMLKEDARRLTRAYSNWSTESLNYLVDSNGLKVANTEEKNSITCEHGLRYFLQCLFLILIQKSISKR